MLPPWIERLTCQAEYKPDADVSSGYVLHCQNIIIPGQIY